MQILGFILMLIGVLMIVGGVNGFRSGVMSKVQFGDASKSTSPATLEGDAARSQALAVGLVGLISVGLGIGFIIKPAIAFIPALIIVTVAGGLVLITQGVQGIQRKTMKVILVIGRQRRTTTGGDLLNKRNFTNYIYTGSQAIIVGGGHILAGLLIWIAVIINIIDLNNIGWGIALFVGAFGVIVLVALLGRLFKPDPALQQKQQS